MGRRAAIVTVLACIFAGASWSTHPWGAGLAAQAGGNAGSSRHLTTVEALRQYPGYYHLRNVLVRGEFADDGARIMLRADDRDIRVQLADGVSTTAGPVEVRGQLIDVGRLEPTDPRVTGLAESREGERWPRPGEELLIRVTAVTSSAPVIGLTVRALALEPWRYDGQKITVLGNFRGRNLFGDLPGAPGLTRYDFVIRGAEGAVWVTGQRPRGRGFDFDIDRRVDTDKWLEVTGTIVHERGLVRIEATQLTLSKEPQLAETPEEPEAPPPPPPPLEVVFSSPTQDEVDIGPGDPIRIQFSRGLDPKSLPGAIRVTYVGAPADAPPPSFATTYDAANRAITLKFAQPLEPFRTVRVDVLDVLRAFDGGVAAPWSVVFSTGRP